MKAPSRRSTRGVVLCGNLRLPCARGRAGTSVLKREGDGATPSGTFNLRQLFYRPDRIGRPQTALRVRPLTPRDGWCDAAADSNYNRRVPFPYHASAEAMWRQDGLYDVVVVIGHNDRPRIKGRGSAIFMHVARNGFLPTEGCIALTRKDLRKLLPLLGPRTRIHL